MDNKETKVDKISNEETNEQKKVSENLQKSVLPPIPKPKRPARSLKDVGKKVAIGPGNFWNNMLSTVLLLIFITALFSYITDTHKKPEELTLTTVVSQVKAGEIKAIVVRGSTLEIEYNDTTKAKGEAKREVDASVSESLTNLGVTSEELAKVQIDVQRETGFCSHYCSLEL
jgi:hypothetical protein